MREFNLTIDRFREMPALQRVAHNMLLIRGAPAPIRL